MKLYISADIEGVCGVTSWSETDLLNHESHQFIAEWTKEIQAVVYTALEMGFRQIYIKDAHDTGRNLKHESFPPETKLIRGWSGHPYGMVEGIEKGFDAAVFVGYHSKAGSNTNPISHTLFPKKVRTIKINGEIASEFLIYYYACAYEKVPVVLVTGDKGLCKDVNRINPYISTVATKEGFGGATINYSPIEVCKQIKAQTKIALDNNVKNPIVLPQTFDIELVFVKHADAYRASFYKGASAFEDGFTVKYRTKDYFDVLRFLSFVISE